MEISPYQIIVSPVITEKSRMAADSGNYTFIVNRRANKIEIAQAISHIFDVDVVRVRIINKAPKFGRWGRKKVQRKSAEKKAIVTLLPGQRIDAFEGA